MSELESLKQYTTVVAANAVRSVAVATLQAFTEATQMLLTHIPLAQSPSIEHILPFAHFVAQLPPQSTSVSSPFFAPSTQLGVAHIFITLQ